MSIEAAIGRIDQILTLQQQIHDPASLTAATSSASGGASLTGSSGTGSSTSFATALAAAQGLTGTTAGVGSTAGLSSGGAASTAGLTGGISAGGAPTQVQAMVDQANALVGKPYVWGGGHSGWGPETGYDCSGFVSAVLHAGGYLSSPADTVSLPSQAGIESGPGQYVTIYDRSGAGENGHVIIDINGQFYESGGESGAWGGGGGVAKIGTPSASYLATFNDVLHPAGL
ncbi:MAG TPA: hypothetical protein VG325_06620 [Solirubrobacteraceae bacterium]|jgi:cell wall-associated NlpC family hydrolase|nr:hypothetical protein [Solirubrobacteraceae bacterium]